MGFLLLSLVLSIVVAFWASLGITEGWKWRMDKKREDTNLLINYHTYHVWRALTNFCFLILPVVAYVLGTVEGVSVLKICVQFIAINTFGWVVYERAMTYVIWDDFLKKKEEFHILGYNLKRPHPMVEVAIGLIALVVVYIF
jgi:hypothetical protein